MHIDGRRNIRGRNPLAKLKAQLHSFASGGEKLARSNEAPGFDT
jgi:hypothetical protein